MRSSLLLIGFLASFGWTSRAPANDLFASRTTLTGANVIVSGNNSGAGSEPGEDIGGGIVFRFYSVWYAWTAPANGVLHLSATTSVGNFFPSIRVYRGTAVEALTLATNLPDDGVAVTTGDTLAIQVASIYYNL